MNQHHIQYIIGIQCQRHPANQYRVKEKVLEFYLDADSILLNIFYSARRAGIFVANICMDLPVPSERYLMQMLVLRYRSDGTAGQYRVFYLQRFRSDGAIFKNVQKYALIHTNFADLIWLTRENQCLNQYDIN